jgi:hypothetical protein
MLAGVNLEHVLDRARLHKAPDGSGKDYLTNREAVRYLLSWNLCLGAMAKFRYERLDGAGRVSIVDVDRAPALVGVRSKRIPGAEHAVVWDPETRKVFDPQEAEPQELSSYEVYEWWPLLRLEEDS